MRGDGRGSSLRKPRTLVNSLVRSVQPQGRTPVPVQFSVEINTLIPF